jgi:hypothetical protein
MRSMYPQLVLVVEIVVDKRLIFSEKKQEVIFFAKTKQSTTNTICKALLCFGTYNERK